MDVLKINDDDDDDDDDEVFIYFDTVDLPYNVTRTHSTVWLTSNGCIQTRTRILLSCAHSRTE